MGSITISLSDESEEKLRDLADKEKRSVTKQVEFLLEYYIDKKGGG